MKSEKVEAYAVCAAFSAAAFALRARSAALRGAFAARVFFCFSILFVSLSLRCPIGTSFQYLQAVEILILRLGGRLSNCGNNLSISKRPAGAGQYPPSTSLILPA
jgi:hypothetical protein